MCVCVCGGGKGGGGGEGGDSKNCAYLFVNTRRHVSDRAGHFQSSSKDKKNNNAFVTFAGRS